MPHLTLSTSDGNTVDLSALPTGGPSSTGIPSPADPVLICPRDGTRSPAPGAAPPKHATSATTTRNFVTSAPPTSTECPANGCSTKPNASNGYTYRFECSLTPARPSPTPSTSRHPQRPAITACTHAARSSSPTERSSPCDRRRDGDLRLRPNRPGTSATERRLETDDLWESRKSVAIAALKRALCDILCGCPASGRGIASLAKLSSL